MSGGRDLASIRLEARPVPGIKCIVIAPAGMMYPVAHVTTATDTPQPLTERELAIANRLVLTWNAHGKLRMALRELVDWCREHTSPLDANSPHQLLVNASGVLAEAAAGDGQQTVAMPPAAPDHLAVLQARYSQLLAMAKALRDCSWLDYDQAASDDLAEAKQNMLDFLEGVERSELASSTAGRA
jgi:hypothetical protein